MELGLSVYNSREDREFESRKESNLRFISDGVIDLLILVLVADNEGWRVAYNEAGRGGRLGGFSVISLIPWISCIRAKSWAKVLY